MFHLGILLLYLVKSAAGIDLIPGFSFGVWGQVFSRRFCGSCAAELVYGTGALKCMQCGSVFQVLAG